MSTGVALPMVSQDRHPTLNTIIHFITLPSVGGQSLRALGGPYLLPRVLIRLLF